MFYELRSINIELTNICNLTCKMCYRNHMNYPKGIMDKELFAYIVNDLKCLNYCLKEVYLHWRGEPCIVPYLPQAIKELKAQLDAKIILFTNGTKLTNKLCELIINAGIDVINFSLDANSVNQYKQIRGIDCFNVVSENIKNCVSLRDKKKAHTLIDIYSVLLEDNMSDILSINQEWGKVVDNLHIKYDMRESSKTKGNSKEKCFWPYKNIIISWDGNVSACCMDVNIDYSLGSVKAQSICEIFSSEIINKLRSSIEESKPINKLCKNCSFMKS